MKRRGRKQDQVPSESDKFSRQSGKKERRGGSSSLHGNVVLEITGTDTDGETLAKPVEWPPEKPLPLIFVRPEKRGHPPLAVGERILARLSRNGQGAWDARIIRMLGKSLTEHVLGILEQRPDGLRLRPTDRKQKNEFTVLDAVDAEPGELVLAQTLPSRQRGMQAVRITERLGHMGEARSISLIAIHTHDLPTVFPPDALDQAKAARPATLGHRTDLRSLPLVTIDGSDARDFDDAVFAEPDTDP
ncbi:MAG: ribonuclease R, partial [Pseudomonadota bacterium]|nr:ribonuclease R [Pseudomonadota bacterium]